MIHGELGNVVETMCKSLILNSEW